MRIILYAGKGGVGKTTMSAATGVECARRGKRTLVMSLDPAHSLSDSFDLAGSLMDFGGGQPVAVDERLWIQELDLQRELEENWGEVFRYLSTLLRTSGLREVLADELAILPGMEEVACLLYINRYAREKKFDVIVLDCAPTGEAMRFISLPTSLEWYMRKLFRLERNIMRVVRPVAKRLSSVPLPEDECFEAVQRLFGRLEGVEKLLQDPAVTTARLVTNPEKMVLKETQRAFTYFHLFDLTVDAIVVNRILPPAVRDEFFAAWRESQQGYIEEAESYFAPVPLWHVELGRREMLGRAELGRLAAKLFKDKDPAAVFFTGKAFEFTKSDGRYVLSIRAPFLKSGEIDLMKNNDELIVRVGSFKRFVALPRRVAALEPSAATLEGGHVRIVFGGSPDGQEDDG
ncbi:MAG: ArsA family ATPase [Planctomycetes bacterium]|nr:ArsA family ATPase [Planctomycetota bacterium]